MGGITGIETTGIRIAERSRLVKIDYRSFVVHVGLEL